MHYGGIVLSENLQDKAVQQAVNYFQISEIELFFGVVIIAVIWVLSTYFLQNRLQKSLMKDIEAYKENVEKRLRDIDYKNGYYNKILDRRVNAYENLYSIISKGCLMEGLGDDAFCGFFVNRNKFHEYHTSLIKLHKDLFWYNKNTKLLYAKYIYIVGCVNDYILGNKISLLEFLKFDESNKEKKISFFDIDPKIDYVEKYLNKSIYVEKTDILEKFDFNTIGIGIILFPLFLEVHDKLLQMIEEDFKHLYDIEKFFDDFYDKK